MGMRRAAEWKNNGRTGPRQSWPGSANTEPVRPSCLVPTRPAERSGTGPWFELIRPRSGRSGIKADQIERAALRSPRRP